MPDVFITLEEAAAFEGITYEAMKKRVQRSPEQHNVKSQAREGGGKDRVLISTSSLSAKARKAWRAAQKVEGSEVIIDKRAQEAVPWYVTADLNQYTEANKKRFYEAVELAARVQDFIDYDGPDRTGYAERYALGLGISPQSLYRYMKNVLEANAWALKLEKEDGKSRDYFRALALCRKPKETGTFPSLTDTELAYYVNQKVNIKWDIDDVTKLYVYDLDGKKICEAVSAELLAFGPHCSQAALEKHLRDQKRNEREVREYLEERVRPYDLRLEDGARPSDAVGMIDLTIKATPSQKLVSLPKDRMFRSEQASKTSRKKATDDTFLNAKGDKALSLLRAMNE